MDKQIKNNLVKYLFPLALIVICAFQIYYQDYKLATPTKSYTLPAILNEISGITNLNENEIACVQDESGYIYVYDLITSTITKEYKNNILGDFEGIAIVGKTIFLLRSDGVIVEYPDFRSPNMKIKEYSLNLPTSNNEGLCYDMKNYRLLIASKIKPSGEKENENLRYIYSFDLKNKVPNNTPLFKLNVTDIKALALKLKIPISSKTNKKTGEKLDVFNFRPSEIAIHPINNNIYILSANDKLILILDEKGVMINLVQLDPFLFNKAEGLAFLSNGTMLISNEAQKGKPTLLTFEFRK